MNGVSPFYPYVDVGRNKWKAGCELFFLYQCFFYQLSTQSGRLIEFGELAFMFNKSGDGI